MLLIVLTSISSHSYRLDLNKVFAGLTVSGVVSSQRPFVKFDLMPKVFFPQQERRKIENQKISMARIKYLARLGSLHEEILQKIALDSDYLQLSTVLSTLINTFMNFFFVVFCPLLFSSLFFHLLYCGNSFLNNIVQRRGLREVIQLHKSSVFTQILCCETEILIISCAPGTNLKMTIQCT